MSIRFGGIASGLDTSSIIQQLMSIERRPLQQMETKKLSTELKKELLAEISSSLSSLQGKVKNFFKASSWNPVKSSISNEDILTATADEDALVGSYEFNVTQLASVTTVSTAELVAGAATAASVTSSGAVAGMDLTKIQDTFANFNGTIASGTITINAVSFTIDKDNTNIDDFMNEVNASSANVTMTYDDIAKTFTLTSKTTGSNAEIDITDNTSFFSTINIDSSLDYTGSGTVDTDAKLASSGIAGLASSGGTFYFKINNYAFSFDENVHSIDHIISTVNNSGAGVSMVYDSQTDKITISNKETGDSYIQFEDLQGNFLESIGVYVSGDLASTQAMQTLGKEAQFSLNGTAMTRDSNIFTINGVEFQLKEAGTSTVNVSKDTDAIYNTIKDFVNQYNSTIEMLNTRLSEEKVKDALTESQMRKGLLRADSTVMGIRSELRNLVTSDVSGLVNTFSSLMEIGITTSSTDFGKSGKLEIDEEELRDAIANNPDAVKKLFFTDSNDDDDIDDGEIGLAASLYNKIDSYISTSTQSINGRTYKVGILPMREASMDDLIEDYEDQIESFSKRMELVEARYWKQFSALETALSQLQNQGNWLTGQLASLPSSS